MKKTNRVFALLLAAIMLFAFTACTSNDISPVEKQSHPSDTAADVTVPTDGNVLIAYFSVEENQEGGGESDLAAGGDLNVIAQMIQTNIGGDLFAIHTEESYPADDEALQIREAEEKDAGARPALTDSIENLDQYDVVFVGFPIWVSDMPMAMYSFFDTYDFAGKTIVPFSMFTSDEPDVVTLIQSLEPDASVVANAFSIRYTKIAEGGVLVNDWLKKLGY